MNFSPKLSVRSSDNFPSICQVCKYNEYISGRGPRSISTFARFLLHKVKSMMHDVATAALQKSITFRFFGIRPRCPRLATTTSKICKKKGLPRSKCGLALRLQKVQFMVGLPAFMGLFLKAKILLAFSLFVDVVSLANSLHQSSIRRNYAPLSHFSKRVENEEKDSNSHPSSIASKPIDIMRDLTIFFCFCPLDRVEPMPNNIPLPS